MTRRFSDRKASRFRRGQRALPARDLNAVVDAVNRPTIGTDTPRQFRRGPAGGSGAPVIILTLISHSDNHLVCEDENSNEYLVAKPYELRTFPWDGNTIGGVAYSYNSPSERVADGVETQFITPSYIAGAEIYSVKPMGGVDIDGTDYDWLEINQGRAWAAEIEDTA